MQIMIFNAAFSKDLVAKRPSEHLVSSELWWSDTKRSLTNAAPENGRTTTVRILTGGRTEEDISSPPYPSIKLTWLLDPGVSVIGKAQDGD